MEKNLVIITNTYPFTQKEFFLDYELPYLLKKFSKIILVPLHFDGDKRPLLEGIEVFTHLAEINSKKTILQKIKKALKVFGYKEFYCELFKNKKNLNYQTFRYLLGYLSFTIEGYLALAQFIQSQCELKSTIFYSYWFHAHASILAMLKEKKFPNLKIISRAHGYDLYEEDYFPPFIPLRVYTIHQMDSIFPISQNGTEYLKKKFPDFRDKFSCSYLGSLPYEGKEECQLANENIFSLVSCASLIPLKRIDMIIKSISLVAQHHPHLIFSWNHLGGGECEEFLKKLANQVLPKNVQWKIHGHVSNQTVYEFYKNFRCDIFLSASQTEGIPVSMMEAQSFGIPIIASNVGGVSEIVTSENGILLSSLPYAEEMATAIITILDDRNAQATMRIKTLESWNSKFNLRKNYTFFSEICLSKGL